MIFFDINRLDDDFKEDYHIKTNDDVFNTAQELINFFINNSLSKFSSEEYSKFLDLCDIANCFFNKEVTQ